MIFLLFLFFYAQAEQYQDIVINSVVINNGARECQKRYEGLKPFLDKYKRKFTVLDIGASQGYFSFRIASEYNSSVIMIEGDYATGGNTAQQLLDLCKENSSLNNIIMLRQHITVEQLERLSDCEHFDVVLALNVIHHFGKNWKRAADAIFKMSDYVVAEIPPSTDKVFAHNEEIKQIEEYLYKKKGQIIAQTPRHTDPTAMSKMLLFATPENNKIKYKHWFYYSPADKYVFYDIKSDFEQKLFIKNDADKVYKRNWVPGINLMTYKALNGVWPDKKVIAKNLLKFLSTDHYDLTPWNVIVQGNNIEAIDWESKPRPDILQSVYQTINFVLLDDINQMQAYLFNVLYPKKNFYRMVMAPTAYGELIDKITILEIKVSKTTDPEKLKNINTELSYLNSTLEKSVSITEELIKLKIKLAEINKKLWVIEDRIREKERAKEFDTDFVKLARDVYFTNDERALIKRKINELLKSGIIEEKIYEQYKVLWDFFTDISQYNNFF